MKRLILPVAILGTLTSNVIAAPHWELPSPITLAQFGGPSPIPPIITSVPYTWTGKQTFSGGLVLSACSGPVTGNGSSAVSCGLITGSQLASGAAATNLGFTPLNPANNLSDVASASTSRTNLGLGTASTKAASASGNSTLASVSGAFTIGHMATFVDAVGTIQDGGAPNTNTGTVTSITCGTGLTGGTVTTTGTCAKDYSTDPVRIRQTVMSGPVSSSTGLPSLLPSTNGALSITTQNVSSSAPLCITAANSYQASPYGELNYTACTSSNLTWSSLTASTNPLYLYVTLSCSAGTCTITPGFTALQPVYQFGGTPATTSGQFTFNYGSMIGYIGNGSTAPQAYIVFIGELVTGSSTVTSSVAYAYDGLYASGWNATFPSASTQTNFNTNLGVAPSWVRVLIQCTTTNQGYSVGDIIDATNAAQASNAGLGVGMTRNAAWFSTASSALYVVPKAGGGPAAITDGDWSYQLIASRGW